MRGRKQESTMRAKSFCCLYKRSAVRTRQFSRRMLKGDGRFGSLDLLHFSISVALSLYSFSLKVSEFLSASCPHADQNQQQNEKQQSCDESNNEKDTRDTCCCCTGLGTTAFVRSRSATGSMSKLRCFPLEGQGCLKLWIERIYLFECSLSSNIVTLFVMRDPLNPGTVQGIHA